MLLFLKSLITHPSSLLRLFHPSAIVRLYSSLLAPTLVYFHSIFHSASYLSNTDLVMFFPASEALQWFPIAYKDLDILCVALPLPFSICIQQCSSHKELLGLLPVSGPCSMSPPPSHHWYLPGKLPAFKIPSNCSFFPVCAAALPSICLSGTCHTRCHLSFHVFQFTGLIGARKPVWHLANRNLVPVEL